MKKMYVFYMYIEIRIQKTIKHYIKNINACLFKYNCIFNSRFAAMLTDYEWEVNYYLLSRKFQTFSLID